MSAPMADSSRSSFFGSSSGVSPYPQAKGKAGADADVDLESGKPLTMAPGMTQLDSSLRWGFVRKVYGIIGAQLAITAVVGSFFALNENARTFALTNQWFQILALVLPFATMIPLFIYRQKHPHNLGLLALWTASLSVTIGLTCSFYKGSIVAEALLLTGLVVLGLSGYTFLAVRNGHNFNFLGPMLFASLLVLVVGSLIHLVLPFGPFGEFLFALVGALIFSLYIVYDTNLLIKRYSYDEFVWASMNLYLDIINLFLRLLEILRHLQGDR